MDYQQTERLINCLDRIATVMEQQWDMQQIPMMDVAAILKRQAEEVSRRGQT